MAKARRWLSEASALVLRPLVERLRQSLVVVVVVALVAATALFVSGYRQQVEQTVVDTNLADPVAATWLLSGVAGSDLPALLPAGSDRLTGTPVAGRAMAWAWASPHAGGVIEATLLWRDDICAHLILVVGTCPAGPAQVAVSTADAAAYRVSPGDHLARRGAVTDSTELTVSGVYQVLDPADPYWFERLPVGRSGSERPGTMRLQGDALVTVRADFPSSTYLETLDVEIEHSKVRVRDLGDLRRWTLDLTSLAAAHRARLVTSVPQQLDHIQVERTRTTQGLSLTLVQLAALMTVVLVLLITVTTTAQRAEVGLARLRGESRNQATKLVVSRWAVVAGAGWLIGCASGLGLLLVTGARLPGQHGLPFGPTTVIAASGVLLVVLLLVVPAARSLVVEPVVDLLSTTTRKAPIGAGRVLVDVVALVLAGAGVLVATQTGTASVLGLATPSLLAVGAGVVASRVLSGLAATALRPRGAGRLRPDRLVRAALAARLRGWRTIVVVVCLGCAFGVFAVQVQEVGKAARERVAEVTTGAPAVVEVTATPQQVVTALDEIDPEHRTSEASSTVVVLTSRVDPAAPQAMFVEPDAFRAVAYGADRAVTPTAWQALAAPGAAELSFTGTTLEARFAPHNDLSRESAGPPVRRGTRVEVSVDYVDAEDVPHTAVLGRLNLRSGPAKQLRVGVGCGDGCRLVRIEVTPDGPVEGDLGMSLLSGPDGDDPLTVDLGSPDRWQSVSTNLGATARATSPSPTGGLALMLESGGGSMVLQHIQLPVSLPVVLGPETEAGVDPTVLGPDGRVQPVHVVAEAQDALPRQLEGAVLANLDVVLRDGIRPGPAAASTQVWLAASSVPELPEITHALRARGIVVVDVATVGEALGAENNSAAGLTTKLAAWLAGVAGVFMVLSLLLVAGQQRAVLVPDLSALVLAGAPRTDLLRAVRSLYRVYVLVPLLVGAVVGAVGCALVLNGLPLVPEAPPAVQLDLGLRVWPLVGTVGAGLLAVIVSAETSFRRLRRGVVSASGGRP